MTSRLRISRPVAPRPVAFVAMSAALLSFFVAAGAPTPLLPLYERDWGFAPWLLTVAFGVYAFALIASLLVAGSLSDHVGRRPVLIGALALELIAMLVLLFSPNIGWLITGRILQGAATGVASSTFGAAIVELAPESRKKLGAVMSSSATTAGLAVGALFSGLIALAIPAAASTTVWVLLAAVIALGTVFAVLTPETSTRRPGALGSLVPRLSVPREVRRLFATSVPTIVATFLVTGLFLGLVPTILAKVFGMTTPIAGGLANFALFGTGTVIGLVTSGIDPRRLKVLGGVGLTLGAVTLLAALALHATDLVWAAAVLAGAGMGAGLSGSIRGLVPEVKPHERALLFSAIFAVAYLTLGGSAISAGFIAAAIGVPAMAAGFAIVIVVVSVLGIAMVASRGTGRRPESVATASTPATRPVPAASV